MERVDPGFIQEARKLGAFDVTACYSCGNCTAACPLSEGTQSFPRKMIRYALLGLKDKIRRSPELWLCYYCGECSDSCPREADPGALMMALRRYAIGRTSLGRIGDLFYGRVFSWILWVLLTAFAVGGVLLVRNPRPDLTKAVPLSFISLGVLHDFGIGVGILLSLVVLFQMIQLARSLGPRGEKIDLGSWIRGFFSTLFKEVLLQKRQRTCEKNGRYLAHLAVFWGFLGLLLATILVFGVDFFGFPEIFRVAAKLAGLSAGAVLMYGCIYFLLKRLGAKDSYSKRSDRSDWVFLGLLFLAGLTGFVLDLFKWLNFPWPTYIAFAVHLVVVFDLLVAVPFTKFAHAFYRPFAVWLTAVKTDSARPAPDAGSGA
jgi:heterodisulfide reductase subunit C